MGTPHPKALRAASQEAWPDTGQTLGNVAQGSVRSEQYRRNIRKVPRRIDSYLTNGRALSRHGPRPRPRVSSGVQTQRQDVWSRFASVLAHAPRTSLPSLCSPILGPGFAPRHFVPRRVRDTKALGQQPVSVPRTLRSATSAFTRVFDALWRVCCRAGARALDPTLIA